MKIATARKKTSKKWRTFDITWEEFVDRLRSPLRTGETVREYFSMPKEEKDAAKEAAGGFVGGALNSGQRKTETVTSRSMLTLDADDVKTDMWRSAVMLLELTMVCYTTHSHTHNKPRFRWIIPTDRPMTPDEYPAVARKIASLLDINSMDPSTYEVARLMYWPTCSKDGEYLFRENSGKLLCVDEVLAEYGDNEAWRDVSLWPIGDKEQEVRSRSVLRLGDPTEKPGLIGLFNRTFDVPSAIDAFLSDVYTDCGNGRYTYTKGSTAGGAVLYNEGLYLYSNHATDPAGGMSCNAFDLVRIHRFGEQDEVCEREGDVPVTKLPSYKAMCKWAAELPEIKSQLLDERMSELADAFGDMANTAADDEDNWVSQLKLNAKTGICEETAKNALLIMMNDPELKDAMSTDMFADRPKLRASVPWRTERNIPKAGLDWTDGDDAGLRLFLQDKWGLELERNIKNAQELLFAQKTFHPVREYLSELVWDGTPRLDTMLTDYFGTEDNAYTRAVSRKWMTAAVKRVMQPGCKFDCVMVMVGEQGIGKSSFADIISKGWFSDSMVDMSSKDGYDSLHGNWIIELAELSSVKRSDVESVKAFVSKREDTYRSAYARRTASHPRQCVFFGSTNDVEFLRDRTGARRFWPVNVITHLDRTKLKENVDQLWAEAKYRYEQGEYLDLDAEDQREGWASMVLSHGVQDELEGQLDAYLDTPLPDNWYDMSPETRRDYIQGNLPGTAQGTVRRDRVCLTEIRVELLNEQRSTGGKDYTSRRLANLMNNNPNWKKLPKKVKLGKEYGAQWVYDRVPSSKELWNSVYR